MDTTNSIDKNEWNTYMKNYYEKNKIKQQARNRQYKLNKKGEINGELKEKYGVYVADIIKIEKLISNIPNNLWSKFIETRQNISETVIKV